MESSGRSACVDTFRDVSTAVLCSNRPISFSVESSTPASARDGTRLLSTAIAKLVVTLLIVAVFGLALCVGSAQPAVIVRGLPASVSVQVVFFSFIFNNHFFE